MLKIKIFAILIALVCFKTDSVLSYSCAVDPHSHLHASTKTPYSFVHGLIKDARVPNCDAVQIWMLTRHGTRNPEKSQIRDMMRLLPEIRDKVIENHERRGNGELCEKDLRNLKKWIVDPDLRVYEPVFLTKQGEKDLITIGERFREYLPELFEADSDKYHFRATDTQRTIHSMKSFIHGAFGNVSMNTEVVPEEKDTLLKIHKICKNWLKQNSSNTDNYVAFKDSPEYRKVIQDVSVRLGFTSDLSLDDVTLIYKTCLFENAWHIDKLSPWCAIFTENELEVLEYDEDLYYYDYVSYGNEKTSLIGCTALHDMYNRFTKLQNGESSEEPKGVFYFSHSSMIQLHLTAMGFAKDLVPLKASNYKTMKDARKWRTSNFVPFAANFAAVFYRCNDSHKVRFYLNEKPMNYEGYDSDVYDWEYVKEKLESAVSACNVDFLQLCNV